MRRAHSIARLLLPLALLPALSACDKPAQPTVADITFVPAAHAKTTRHASGFVLWDAPRSVPALAFQGSDGQPLGLDKFRGKVVVLNIWATWCGPCREEMPTLDNLQAKLGGPDLEVLTLSIDQAGPEVVRKFFKEVGVKHLRLYIDPTAQTLNVLDILGLPTTLLVDRQGRELGRLIGAATWDSPKMIDFLQDVVKRTQGDKP